MPARGESALRIVALAVLAATALAWWRWSDIDAALARWSQSAQKDYRKYSAQGDEYAERAVTLLAQHKDAEARALFQQALAAYQKAPDGFRQAKMLEALGGVEHKLGELAAAHASYERAAQFYLEQKDDAGRMRTGAELAVLDYELERYDAARRRWLDVIPLAEAADDRVLVAGLLVNLGAAEMRLRRFIEARLSMTRALDIYTDLQDGSGWAHALQALGAVAQADGRPDEARRLLTRAAYGYDVAGGRAEHGYVLASLALLELHEGRPSAARRLIDQALTLANSEDNSSSYAYALRVLGDVEASGGHRDLARSAYVNSLNAYDMLGDRIGRADTVLRLRALDAAQMHPVPGGNG